MSFISFPSPVPVADGGTGTSNPSLVAGAGIAVGGPWPNQTVSATGTSYVEVSTYADLPAPGTVTGEIYVVLQSMGVYFINRRAAGFYYSDGVVWSYLAELGENYFNDANLEFFDDADPSKIVRFQLSGLTTGTTRTYAMPDANGTMALLADIPPAGVQTVTASAPLVSSGGANPDISITSPLPIANGGTATATPALVEGTNITITGAWPNQTINATSSGSANVRRDVISVPASTLLYESVVAAVGVTAASKLVPVIVWDGDDDENGTEELEDLDVFAVPDTDQITYTLSTRTGFFSGDVKVNTLIA